MKNPKIQVYNTLSRQKEELKPRSQGSLNIFVCGPTVYDYIHMGNAKTYTQFDFIVSYLRHRGFKVTYVRNITDIDDKIIGRAREEKISWKDLSEKYLAAYTKDMNGLHNTAVTKYARASEYIQQIVQQIETLIEKGCVYSTSDGMYFEISTFKDYGQLSGRVSVEKDDAVSRIDDSQEKKGWNDFCVWKKSKEDEPSWDAPFGPGRPGWHIEDTAITEHFFGCQYDMHGGAVDLIFPHHEAEIALMESVSEKKPFVHYWLHTGFLNIRTGKMSKSKKNFLTVREVLENYDYRVIRFLFLSAHYRSAIQFADGLLIQSAGALKRLNEFVASIDTEYDDADHQDVIDQLQNRFYSILDDDFDTPNAFAEIFNAISALNKSKARTGRRLYAFFQVVNELFDILTIERGGIDEQVEVLIKQREVYRAQKRFVKADEIRNKLTDMGIKLYDTEDGVRWKKVDTTISQY